MMNINNGVLGLSAIKENYLFVIHFKYASCHGPCIGMQDIFNVLIYLKRLTSILYRQNESSKQG